MDSPAAEAAADMDVSRFVGDPLKILYVTENCFRMLAGFTPAGINQTLRKTFSKKNSITD